MGVRIQEENPSRAPPVCRAQHGADLCWGLMTNSIRASQTFATCPHLLPAPNSGLFVGQTAEECQAGGPPSPSPPCSSAPHPHCSPQYPGVPQTVFMVSCSSTILESPKSPWGHTGRGQTDGCPPGWEAPGCSPSAQHPPIFRGASGDRSAYSRFSGFRSRCTTPFSCKYCGDGGRKGFSRAAEEGRFPFRVSIFKTYLLPRKPHFQVAWQ